jgi:hypothetical protein
VHPSALKDARRPAQLWSRVERAFLAIHIIHDLAPTAFDGGRVVGSRVINGDTAASGGQMSERNGDRARFQKDLKRKRLRRQRIKGLIKTATSERRGHRR